MTGRLPAALQASALLRLAESQGGFGVVAAKGGADGGTVLVILLERGGKAALVERVLDTDGSYRWRRDSGEIDSAMLQERVSKRLRIDPDLWVLELDVVCAERFVAEMNAAR